MAYSDSLFSVDMLKGRSAHENQEWLQKLPLMVKELESILYDAAPSLEAYRDTNTLRYRLRDLARSMFLERKSMPGNDCSMSLLEEQLSLFSF